MSYGLAVNGTATPTGMNGSCYAQESYQTWTLNATFEAQNTGGGGKLGGEVTTTSSLPTKPTGSVQVGGARNALHIPFGWDMVLAMVVMTFSAV